MQALLVEGRAQTDDWRFWHVGELNFSFFMIACHLDPCRHIRLWRDAGGKLVAYATVGEDPAFDWQVLPEHAWRGIEQAALDWAEALVGELRREDLQAWGGGMVANARQDDPQRIAFLEQHGFRYSGDFTEVNMLRRLDDALPEAVIPVGWQVRPVLDTPSEIARRAAAQREVWQPWTVGNVSDQDYASFMRMPGYEQELDIAAVGPDGVIAAYVNGWNDPVNRIGDLGPVGALPAYRRRGLTPRRAAGMHAANAGCRDGACVRLDHAYEYPGDPALRVGRVQDCEQDAGLRQARTAGDLITGDDAMIGDLEKIGIRPRSAIGQ